MNRPSLQSFVLATALLFAGASRVGLGTAPAAATKPMAACRAAAEYRAAIGSERPS